MALAVPYQNMLITSGKTFTNLCSHTHTPALLFPLVFGTIWWLVATIFHPFLHTTSSARVGKGSFALVQQRTFTVYFHRMLATHTYTHIHTYTLIIIIIAAGRRHIALRPVRSAPSTSPGLKKPRWPNRVAGKLGCDLDY